MVQTKPVDIHFVSWQRPEITELAIRTIARNTLSGNYRLVVLDNGSDLSQQETLRRLHDNGLIDELILWDTNRGLEVARNYLLEGSNTEYIICADNDCLPEPMDETDWIDKLVLLMQKYEDFGAISCRTQVMIGTGNIFEEADQTGADIVEFPHPGGSLRIMRTRAVKQVGGWEGKPGRGSEERYICGKLNEAGFRTAFAVNIKTLHLFGLKNTDRWGYSKDWTPEQTGHSDISHPVLENGDDILEVERYTGEALAEYYANCNN